jgi:AcrR family transcriptional regulator
MRSVDRARIVAAALKLLDSGGELTFRALAAKLRTGAGAIYWHVANKDELLAAATDHVIALDAKRGKPAEVIRAVALGLFDAIEAHPWVGPVLSRAPWQASTLAIFERIGAQLAALGVAEDKQFLVASTLVSYILGVAGQNAANARAGFTDRDAMLHAESARWAAFDPATHPFTRRMADQLRDHDDRDQFLAGIDLILAGLN